MLVCLLATGCAQLETMFHHVVYGPGARGSRGDADAEPAADRAAGAQCEERVVYKHHFSERVVVEQAERKAGLARIGQLEGQIDRLQSDLAQAEKALIAAESSLSGAHTRGHAVRAIAEARTQVENAEVEAPWRHSEAQEARDKLEEADRQLRADRFGASILFASRAQRIARTLVAEAQALRSGKQARQIGARPVRLRAHASGKSDLVAKLEPHTPVFPEKEYGAWVLVRTLGGEVGWIPTSALAGPPASPAR